MVPTYVGRASCTQSSQFKSICGENLVYIVLYAICGPGESSIGEPKALALVFGISRFKGARPLQEYRAYVSDPCDITSATPNRSVERVLMSSEGMLERSYETNNLIDL